ncbi:helix-turn-helix domain-containing protein [Maribacter stanieri]|uniref:helix-turn-helix transcriptional regulator n=1 Tax=Maribacter stanieri TaxID=440514 RepID=UPI0030DCD184|tara:strand:+ start:660 stop:854 length:195 start_codon:yes stop_codon:yes gene_type:complete
MNKIDEKILNQKEFLTVKETAILLSCSVKSIYRSINDGRIKVTNLGDRMTRIKRSDIDDLFKAK